MITPLPYTLHTRYRSIALAWTVILIPPTILNIGLFYDLWFGTSLDRILVLTLPTGILGIFTIIAIIERIYKLTKSSPEYRPLNGSRFSLDVFQWGYFGALILISALISSALARGDVDADGHELQIRLVSLPAALLMFFLAVLTLLSLVLNGVGVKLPFRFGSVEKGNVVRPAVFYIVEDVVAVDGNGGVEFREKWGERYEGSVVFRKMVLEVSVVWMVAFFVLSGVFTVLVMWLPVEAVYAVGWAGPFPIAGLMAVWTIYYVKAMLKAEKEAEGGSVENGNVNGNGQAPRQGGNETTPLLDRA
ncbi:uncharacterized protein LY89DRAFT_654090 [Mollisia scopiformis]|uniref:Uncharacterized protein n=1 Tax=Mollisia scopiformis TaxID=149040 RepID=A0A194WU29_MOLSC|nr:uncharacterized protein LY89DRAFT_654090 [Mollisia scopiformis]KUJ11465.1 hypothetical protein LY89DRAFT_654090 [Mollisia scopiformis]